MLEWSDLGPDFSDETLQALSSYIERQRWFGDKGHELVGLDLVDRALLRDTPLLVLALVEARLGSGTSRMYQLPLGLRSADQNDGDAAWIGALAEGVLVDASGEAALAEFIARPSSGEIRLAGRSGEFGVHVVREEPREGTQVRLLHAEQSNTSLVVNDRLVMKIYRRLEAGINPELEMLLFLTEHGFSHLPELTGWSSYHGQAFTGTLSVTQRFLPEAVDGWRLGLREAAEDRRHFIARLARLGEVIGEMHCVLSSDAEDPDFAPESPTPESGSILGVRLAEQIDSLRNEIPDDRRGELLSFADRATKVPVSGFSIRCHGDLHLGQVLWSGDDWYVIDFEGEPARTMAQRRNKAHPLRDVAGMLRSFAYLGAALGTEDGTGVASDFESQATEQFLRGYRARIGASGLMPENLDTQRRMIRMFELEKILYEIDYELHNRPDWLTVPLIGIDRLLAEALD